MKNLRPSFEIEKEERKRFDWSVKLVNQLLDRQRRLVQRVVGPPPVAVPLLVSAIGYYAARPSTAAVRVVLFYGCI